MQFGRLSQRRNVRHLVDLRAVAGRLQHIERIRLGMLFKGIGFVQTSQGENNRTCRSSRTNLAQRFHDFLQGVIHHTDHHNDHVRGGIEMIQIVRRIVADFAQPPRVQEPHNRLLAVGKIILRRCSGLRTKSIPDLGLRHPSEISDNRRLAAAGLAKQPEDGDRRLFEQLAPLPFELLIRKRSESEPRFKTAEHGVIVTTGSNSVRY